MVERQPLDVLEAMHSTRSIRFLKPDPIPDEVIWAILDAAIRGPNGSNTQRWGWIVVRDPEVRLKLAEWYRDGWNLANRVEKRSREDRFEIARTNPLGYQGYLGVEYLAENLEHAPVHIIPVTIGARPSLRSGSSIYGAVQNLQLAARAFGVGSTFTTAHAIQDHAEDVQALLGLPENAVDMCLIPLGYPMTAEELAELGASPNQGRFGVPRRTPVEQVTHWDRWGVQEARGDSTG